MRELQTLLAGLRFPEQPRWHEDRLWFSDWGTREVIAVDLDGNGEVVLRGPSFPLCADWLPDGRLLLVAARDGRLLCREPDGSQSRYADLSQLSERPPGNEMVVDGRGNVYVNGGGFDLMAGEEFAPGMIAVVDRDGSARVVADDLAFPNGMHIAPDRSTLIVAESYARRLTAFHIGADGSLSNRRVWADLGDGVPDGICVDTEHAVGTPMSPTSAACASAAAGSRPRRIRLLDLAASEYCGQNEQSDRGRRIAPPLVEPQRRARARASRGYPSRASEVKHGVE